MPKRARIMVFGEVMMRLQVPGYELLSQANTLNYSFSGTGVNVGSALARFGHESFLATRLPDNAIGDAAVSYIHKLGLSTAYTIRGGKYLGMYFLENGFGSRPGRVTYTNRQESSFNTAPATCYDYHSMAREIELIHFCGISLAMNDAIRDHMFNLARAVKNCGGRIVFDCNYRPAHWGAGGYEKAKPYYEEMLSLADVVLMNEKDAIHILGMPATAATRKEQAINLLPEVARHYDVGLIAGTHRSIHPDNTHSLEAFLYKQDQFFFSDPLNFAVYDRIGAGDAFASGIIHGELAMLPPDRAVQFAATAAMLAHTIVGDTPMSTVQEIERAMTETAGDVIR